MATMVGCISVFVYVYDALAVNNEQKYETPHKTHGCFILGIWLHLGGWVQEPCCFWGEVKGHLNPPIVNSLENFLNMMITSKS